MQPPRGQFSGPRSEELARAWGWRSGRGRGGNRPAGRTWPRVAELGQAYAEFCDGPRGSGDRSVVSAVAVVTGGTVDRLNCRVAAARLPPAWVEGFVGGWRAHLAWLALPVGCHLRRWRH